MACEGESACKGEGPSRTGVQGEGGSYRARARAALMWAKAGVQGGREHNVMRRTVQHIAQHMVAARPRIGPGPAMPPCMRACESAFSCGCTVTGISTRVAAQRGIRRTDTRVLAGVRFRRRYYDYVLVT